MNAFIAILKELFRKNEPLNRSEIIGWISIGTSLVIFCVQVFVIVELKQQALNKKFNYETMIELRSISAWAVQINNDVDSLRKEVLCGSPSGEQLRYLQRLQDFSFKNYVDLQRLESCLRERSRALNDYNGETR